MFKWKETLNHSFMIPMRISFCIPITVSSLIFKGASCSIHIVFSLCLCEIYCNKNSKIWYIYIYIFNHVGVSHYWMLRCICVFMNIIYSAFWRVSGLSHMCAFAHLCALRVISGIHIYICIHIFIMSGHPIIECYGVFVCLYISYTLRVCAYQAYHICVRLHTHVHFVNI